MNKRISTLALSMLVATLSAWGSGFLIVEQGASNMGTALAGAAVNANNDASAAYWNPSAGFFVESNGKMDFGGSFIVPTMQFTGSAYYPNHGSLAGQEIPGGDGGNAGKLAFVPNFFFVKKFTDDLLMTFALTSPFGLETCYENDFVGRLHGLKSNVITLEINPSIAYKVTDWFSISVGASAHYVNADLTSYTYTGYPPPYPAEVATRANAHGWTGSFNVGATFKFLETGRIGVSYRHKVSHEVKGAIYSPAGSTPLTAEMDLPSTLTAGVYYRFKEELSPFALMFDYSFTQWKLFDALTFKGNDGTILSSTPENWRNTSRFSAGIHYYPTWNEDLTFRMGLAYDQNPVRDAEYRTPRIPDADRLWVSCGLGLQIDWLNIDIAYTYILFNNVSIDNHDSNYGVIRGEYTGHAHVLSLQAGIKW